MLVRASTRSGLKEVGEELDAVDEPRTRAGEGGGGVDSEELVRAERVQALLVLERLRLRVLQVPAAGHRDDDVGIESLESLPLDLR